MKNIAKTMRHATANPAMSGLKPPRLPSGLPVRDRTQTGGQASDGASKTGQAPDDWQAGVCPTFLAGKLDTIVTVLF
jgi:hypothetical protein